MPPDCVGEVIDVMPVHQPQRPLCRRLRGGVPAMKLPIAAWLPRYQASRLRGMGSGR
jgi:hypothetical protein